MCTVWVETGVLLSNLDSIQVLVRENNRQDRHRTGIERQMVTAIEYMDADGSYPKSMVIWLTPCDVPSRTTFSAGLALYFSARMWNESGFSECSINKPLIVRMLNFKCVGFGHYDSLENLESFSASEIIVVDLSSNTSYKICSFDIAISFSAQGGLPRPYRAAATRRRDNHQQTEFDLSQ